MEIRLRNVQQVEIYILRYKVKTKRIITIEHTLQSTAFHTIIGMESKKRNK